VGNVYELFLEHVAVTWVRADERVACSAGAAPACPGLGTVLRVTTQRMQGEKRRCVMVKVPVQGRLELGIEHDDALELLTGTIVALPGNPAGSPQFAITTSADGVEQPRVVLSKRSAVRPSHPRARRELRFGFERFDNPTAAATEATEICLQLTTLGSQ
jgi:hypothetical protein